MRMRIQVIQVIRIRIRIRIHNIGWTMDILLVSRLVEQLLYFVPFSFVPKPIDLTLSGYSGCSPCLFLRLPLRQNRASIPIFLWVFSFRFPAISYFLAACSRSPPSSQQTNTGISWHISVSGLIDVTKDSLFIVFVTRKQKTVFTDRLFSLSINNIDFHSRQSDRLF